MKKNYSLYDDLWTIPSFDAGDGAAALGPGYPSHTIVLDDDGDPYPLADTTGGSTSVSADAAKPVATVPQLADYLVNGFW
ncbi:MAG: hypothetical protein ACJ8EL_19200, partial [Rhizomicrobium sp.]